MPERYDLKLLAPNNQGHTPAFGRFRCSHSMYTKYMHSLKRLRAEAYLEDGAIASSDIDDSGCFHMIADEDSWHLLLVQTNTDEVIACVRFLVHRNTVSVNDLLIAKSVLAWDTEVGPAVQRMIEADLLLARRDNLGYVEVGGLAIAKPWRASKAALDILAGSYALGELWGGCLGLCTATFRHGSASMIRRFSGLTSSTDVGPFAVYYDPHYACPMEVLRFRRRPAERYIGFVAEMKARLMSMRPLARIVPENDSSALVA